jgi:hypothetical protein
MTNNRNVHVPMGRSDITTTTITTDRLATCLFFLIDGVGKTLFLLICITAYLVLMQMQGY